MATQKIFRRILTVCLILGLVLVFQACSAQNKKDTITIPPIKIQEKPINFGFRKKAEKDKDTARKEISAFIIHTMYNPESKDSFLLDTCLNLLKRYDVAPHYIIDREGNTYRLIPDNKIAYHAGHGKTPDGRTGINAFSIGVELINSKYTAPTEAQYLALSGLTLYLKANYSINQILGHEEIAPGRRTDPWNFDWVRYREMIGETKP